jgi:pimeloyl-ACP methyl ester carboxylesterase
MGKFIKRAALVLLLLLVALTAWFWTPDRSVDELRATYANNASQFVELANGVTVHLRDEGPRNAPAIILLHGSSASLHTWEPWVEALSEDFRVITYDQPGHGLTGPHPDAAYTAADFVETVDNVADALDLASFTLGGNSMGGWISWNYAIAHGDRLDGLLLVDASGAPDSEPTTIPIGFRIASMPVISTLMSKITPRSMIERSLRQSVSNQEMIDDAMVDRYYELLLYPGNRTATGERFRTERSAATAEAMQEITVPTLIMWGDEDELIPVSAGGWFDEHIPDSAMVRYPGIGHIPQEESAEQSAGDVLAWLSGVYATDTAAEAAE